MTDNPNSYFLCICFNELFLDPLEVTASVILFDHVGRVKHIASLSIDREHPQLLVTWGRDVLSEITELSKFSLCLFLPIEIPINDFSKLLKKWTVLIISKFLNVLGCEIVVT